MRLPILALACLPLAACVTTIPVAIEPLDGTISGQCHIDTVKGAVGLAAAPATLERIRVDSDSNTLTTTGSGTAANADSGGERVSVQVGPSNAITGIGCG